MNQPPIQGTTEDELRLVLEEGSGMKAGVDFHLAYSPEREDPGREDANVKTIPKVVGGFTPKCVDLAEALYGQALDKIHRVSSCKAAEATKLLENIFRSVNIALVNELKVVYEAMGIDVHEVIDAAATKPFGFMAFRPGPGLGGHCIPIDPFYLTWKAREFGKNTRFIELAGEINTNMPDYVVSKVADALNDQGKAVKGSKILVLGLAYKANVDDCRNLHPLFFWKNSKQRVQWLIITIHMYPLCRPPVSMHILMVNNPLILRMLMISFSCLLIILSTRNLISVIIPALLWILEIALKRGLKNTIRLE